jgi:hypothetical protein
VSETPEQVLQVLSQSKHSPLTIVWPFSRSHSGPGLTIQAPLTKTKGSSQEVQEESETSLQVLHDLSQGTH